MKNEKVAETCEGFIKELLDISNVSEEEVERAKGLLIRAVSRRGLDPSKRLVKNVQMLAYTGKLTSTEDFVRTVEAVNKENVKNLMESLRKSYPTLVAIGGNIHGVPNVENIHIKLK